MYNGVYIKGAISIKFIHIVYNGVYIIQFVRGFFDIFNFFFLSVFALIISNDCQIIKS